MDANLLGPPEANPMLLERFCQSGEMPSLLPGACGYGTLCADLAAHLVVSGNSRFDLVCLMQRRIRSAYWGCRPR